MSTIRVLVDDRRFIVDFDGAGRPIRIKERKKQRPGHAYLERIVELPYWSAKHHKLGGPKTLPFRIITAARDAAGLKG